MHEQDWVSFQCVCGFRLQRLPRAVMDDLPRCLGCGRSLRGSEGLALRTRALTDVRDLR